MREWERGRNKRAKQCHKYWEKLKLQEELIELLLATFAISCDAVVCHIVLV